MVQIQDTVVVGAGPAGAAAALELAKAGTSTLLIDKAFFPRDKCCGDGLTSLALRQLEELDFDPATTPSWTWIDSVALRSTSSRISKMKFPGDRGHFAAVVRRIELDEALVKLSIRGGAHFLGGTTVSSMRILGDSSVELVLSNGESVRARQLIAADGAHSSIRKLLKKDRVPDSGDWHAFRQYFPFQGDPNELFVSFEVDLLPAYFWAFPLADGTANIGFGVHTQSISRLGEMAGLWRDIQSREHLNQYFCLEPTERLKAWPIPANIRNQCLSIGPVLFVGDAASASDPLTGEGIAQALETGRLAAQAILRSNHSGTGKAADLYEASVQESLFTDDRWSRYLMAGLSHRKGTRLGVRLAGASPYWGSLMARWMFEDFHRNQIMNPRTLFSKGTGAY